MSATVARLRAALRLLSPDHITAEGRRILEKVLDAEENNRSTDTNPTKGTVMNTTKDPEALIGYKDEDGCLIPIRNWDPGHVFHGQPVPEGLTPVYEKDINDDDWRVTI